LILGVADTLIGVAGLLLLIYYVLLGFAGLIIGFADWLFGLRYSLLLFYLTLFSIDDGLLGFYHGLLLKIERIRQKGGSPFVLSLFYFASLNCNFTIAL